MKNGKISESVLKRSVLKQLHTKSDRILFKPAVGEDCAVISMQAGDQTKLVTATQTFTLDVSDKHVRANCAVYDALNNIYAMGAGPIGIELALLVPTTENEAVLRETVLFHTVPLETSHRCIRCHTSAIREVFCNQLQDTEHSVISNSQRIRTCQKYTFRIWFSIH